jgi:GH35 family endo-1,4-beta-xylanase
MNRLLTKTFVCTAFVGFFSTAAHAQLSSNPDKFLGNITTGWNNDMDTNGFIFSDYWNQVTPENATKWGSVEGNARGKFSWGGADKAYKYAKNHGFPFKFHTLVWGSQYPSWLDRLSTEDQYAAIVEWMDEAKAHYPDLPVIDVVNEAVSGHAPAPYRAALGGEGRTGYDWIIKAFELAYERWPDAILVYNDYNTFQWNTDQFIDLVTVLRDAGAPIDAYGCQSHDLTGCSANTLKASMKKLQDALQMPMYVTEYDIGTSSDNDQLRDYKAQIPLLWEADYCAGVTLWGWIYGSTWTTDGNSGLIKNKKERPALEWLREYMQTDAAKNAKSPFPGMVKEASVYVKPAALGVEKGTTVPITVTVRLKTKELDKVELFVNGEKVPSLFAECIVLQPGARNIFQADYTPTKEGKYEIKAVVTADDGTKYERLSGFRVFSARAPFNGEKEVPGIIEAEDFDSGSDGQTFHDSDNTNEGDVKNYRSDAGGVDLVKGNNGCVIGYTATGEWLEYTINVKEAGTYSYEATVSSGSTGSGFNIDVIKADGSVVALAKVDVPQTGNNDWSKYKAVKGEFKAPLEAGKQTLRITINAPYVNFDKIELKLSGTGIQAVESDASADQNIYNLYGMKVDKNYKGIVIKNGKKIINR